ncbi:MAG: DNA-directed DNA polymerase [Candidatus Jordarchaeum sp.]|uniref:DNA-directed DNA polymerase n=1 Tax=Candidatus Jordarchaeum sp. TaxID=2823881 RepID=UPI004048ED8B
MRLDFWILDVGQTVEDGVSKVLLWGIDSKDNRVLVVDDTFKPYFYVLPEEGVDAGVLARSLKGLSVEDSPILGVDVVRRRLFGKSLDVVRVVFQNFDYASKYVKLFKKSAGVADCVEVDVRHYVRYLADKGVHPCSWYSAEVQKVGDVKNGGYSVFSLLEDLKSVERVDLPNLRVLAFDIEVYSPSGALNPDKEPVIIISTVTSRDEEQQFIARDKDDLNVFKGFIKYVSVFDPDVIVGYDSNFFDFPFLIGRAKRLRVKFALGRDGSEPHLSVYGHVSVAGRAHLDLYDMVDMVVEVKVKTLKNIADYLKVMAKNSRVLIDHSQIPKYWDDKDLRKQLLQYASQDAKSTIGVAEKLLPTAISMAQVSGMPMDQVMRAGVGFRVENMLMAEAHSIDELIPNKTISREGTYIGGYVLKPVPGVHDNIAVFDFASMYPNLMIKYNISPDTYVPPDEKVSENKLNIAPVGHRFRKEPPGFYKRIIENLIEERKKIQKNMAKLKPHTLQYSMMDERQKAFKIMTNAVYGYAGWFGARWYLKPVAEATSAWGREFIKETIELAKSHGLNVIYADTDSVFITNSEKVEQFDREVTQKLGLEIKPDKVYKRVFFTEAKKKYAGLLKDGTLDVVGFEIVRGDWPEIAREVQETVLNIVLREKDLDKAIKFVNDTIRKLREGKVSLEELVIWETLTKTPDKYKIKAPHVIAAKRLIKEGGRLEAGSKIGYVIVKGEGSISDRAIPYSLADISKVDIEYYINRQVVSAALRVLEYFGVKENQFIDKKITRQLKLQ